MSTSTQTKPAEEAVDQAEGFIRGLVAERMGGATFDQGGSYVFSAMIKAENDLEALSVEGDPSTAVLRFSVADPVLKMDEDNFTCGIDYYVNCDDSTRYTDLGGVKNFELCGMNFSDTQECLAFLLNTKYPILGQETDLLSSDNVQYTYDGIKGPLGTHIPTAFFDENTVVLMPNPSYPVIVSESNRMGAEVIKFDIPEFEDGFDITVDVLENVISQNKDQIEGKKVFIYLNIPHNPTGFIFDLAKWRNLIKWAKKNGVYLIVDEAYTDLDYTGNASSVLEAKGWQDVCLVLQSVSKAHRATGIRFGWVLGHEIAIKVIRNVMDGKNSGLFGPSIVAGLNCLADEEGQEKTKSLYYGLHKKLFDALAGAGFESSMPQAGLCQLTPCPKSACNKSSSEVIEFENPTAFANWMRKELLISMMPQDALGKLRWAITFREQPKYGLGSVEASLVEAGRRLGDYQFKF